MLIFLPHITPEQIALRFAHIQTPGDGTHRVGRAPVFPMALSNPALQKYANLELVLVAQRARTLAKTQAECHSTGVRQLASGRRPADTWVLPGPP